MNSEGVTRRVARYGWLPLLALATTTALESGERQSLSQAVDGIQHRFGVSNSAVGWLPFAMAIVGVLGAVPVGILTDRIRRTWLLAWAVGIWTACMGLNGLATSYALLFAARMGVGAVEANGPAAVSLLSDYYPVKDRARMMGLYQSGALIGAIVGLVAGGVAVHRNFDTYHGSTIRGFRREKPFLHVIGLRPVLEEWGGLHGLRPEWIQPEKRRKVAHYDVFGPAAEALIARLKPRLDGQ